MATREALKQASYEAEFLEGQPQEFVLLWRQFALNIRADAESRAYRIECNGDPEVVALVEEIRGSLIACPGWDLLITL
jgi:hypothetical protein